MCRNIAKSSFKVGRNIWDQHDSAPSQMLQWHQRAIDMHAWVVLLRFYDTTK